MLGLLTTFAVLHCSSRHLFTFSLFTHEPSKTGPSDLEAHPLEHREAATLFNEALKEEVPFVRANATTGIDEANAEDGLENLEAGDELQSVEDLQSVPKDEESVEDLQSVSEKDQPEEELQSVSEEEQPEEEPVEESVEELQSISKEEENAEDNGNESEDTDEDVGRDARADVVQKPDDNDDEKKSEEDVEEILADAKLQTERRDSKESGASAEEEEAHAEEEALKEEGDAGDKKVPDAMAYLAQLATNLTKTGVDDDNGPYHNRRIFEIEYAEMKRSMRIFIYPHRKNDPSVNIYRPITRSPKGNYASEEFFQQALYRSGFVTQDANNANFFFMPVSITKARQDKRIKVAGLKAFCAKYVKGVRELYNHWNRSNGADHFYLSCHSIARGAMDAVPYVRENAIQLLCPSSYFLYNYIAHKDASVPQIWPRPNIASQELTKLGRRTRLAFFAGAANSPVRRELVRLWGKDDQILIHQGKVPYPYSRGLLTSKFCLQVKGFEVNTARLGDSMFYGCVPVIIADYYDLPWQDILDYTKFSIVVANDDIPLLKKTLEAVTDEQYAELHKNVMLARKHFIWHNPAEEYDAFYSVMYELWKRRHIVRRTSS